MRNLVIVIGRCHSTKQGFGVRFQRGDADKWHATWGFAIKDSVAQREGYEQTQLEGQFIFDDSFPGCPHCNTDHFCVCSCGKLFCIKANAPKVTCPWCQLTGEVSGQATRMFASGDR